MIDISQTAQAYLRDLLAKQEEAEVGIRVFVAQPGTPHAETCIAYCRPGEEQADDEVVELTGFRAFIEKKSIRYLEDAVVDFVKDSMGGQLTIKAPNSRMPKITDDSPLADRVNYILYNQINPGHAAHGGHVTLEELTEAREPEQCAQVLTRHLSTTALTIFNYYGGPERPEMINEVLNRQVWTCGGHG